MNRILLLITGLLLVQPAWAQLRDATPNQTQSLRDAGSVELEPGFSSTGDISITIDAPLNAFGRWATEPNWGVFIGTHTSVLPNGNVLSWQGHNDTPMPGGMVMGTSAYLWNTATVG